MVPGTETLAAKASGHEGNDDGSHSVVHTPDPALIAKAKAQLSQGLGQGEDIGQTKTALYKGKSMEAGQGGRSLMMQDRITLELVNKGFSFEQAQAIAKKQTFKHFVDKYGNGDFAKAKEAMQHLKAAKASSVEVQTPVVK